MDCIRPLYIKTVPFPVPCGKCPACLQNKRLEWVTRLKAELADNDFALFVTLTYDEKHLGRVLEVMTRNQKSVNHFFKRSVQLFLKRLRKKRSLRYFIVNEYGDRTGRPHFHGILYFKGIKLSQDLYDDITKAWQNGFVQYGTATPASIAYVTKYIMKHVTGDMRSFILSSRKPGIGDTYILKNKEYHKSTLNISTMRFEGFTVPLPRLQRDKIKKEFNDEQLQQIDEERVEYLRKKFADYEREYWRRPADWHQTQKQLKVDKLVRHVKPQTIF